MDLNRHMGLVHSNIFSLVVKLLTTFVMYQLPVIKVLMFSFMHQFSLKVCLFGSAVLLVGHCTVMCSYTCMWGQVTLYSTS